MITAHADVVGSLLRPQELSEARSRFAAGEVEASRLRELEDRAVCDAIAMQEAAGLEIVTDGEMRRQSFQSQMTAAVEGFGDFTMDAFLWGEWHNAQGTVRTARPQNLGATGKLVRKRWLSADEFAFLKNKTSRVAKITLPSPGLWANFWSREHSRAAYPTLDSFLADIVQLLREEVQELARLGARYIQIDAPHYGLMLDAKTRRFYEAQGWSLDQWLTHGIELDNAHHRGISRCHFRAPSLTRQSGRPVARRGRLRIDQSRALPAAEGTAAPARVRRRSRRHVRGAQGHPRRQIHRARLDHQQNRPA